MTISQCDGDPVRTRHAAVPHGAQERPRYGGDDIVRRPKNPLPRPLPWVQGRGRAVLELPLQYSKSTAPPTNSIFPILLTVTASQSTRPATRRFVPLCLRGQFALPTVPARRS